MCEVEGEVMHEREGEVKGEGVYVWGWRRSDAWDGGRDSVGEGVGEVGERERVVEWEGKGNRKGREGEREKGDEEDEKELEDVKDNEEIWKRKKEKW